MTPHPVPFDAIEASAVAPAPARIARARLAAPLAPPRCAPPRLAMLVAAGLLATSLASPPAFAQGGAAAASPAAAPAAATAAAPTAPAPAASSGPVTVDNAWVRATVSKQRSTGAFFGLSSSQPMRLVAVESPAAEIVEVHEMALVDNIMRMRAVDAVPLAPGQRVELQPGGLHVMLIDLRKPIQVGDVVPLTLVFENDKGQRSTQAISATVRPLTATGSGDGAAAAGHGEHGSHGGSGGGHGDHGSHGAGGSR